MGPPEGTLPLYCALCAETILLGKMRRSTVWSSTVWFSPFLVFPLLSLSRKAKEVLVVAVLGQVMGTKKNRRKEGASVFERRRGGGEKSFSDPPSAADEEKDPRARSGVSPPKTTSTKNRSPLSLSCGMSRIFCTFSTGAPFSPPSRLVAPERGKAAFQYPVRHIPSLLFFGGPTLCRLSIHHILAERTREKKKQNPACLPPPSKKVQKIFLQRRPSFQNIGKDESGSRAEKRGGGSRVEAG